MKKVIIIGSGPAGYPCALKLKSYGVDVKIVEKDVFGGTCLNRGCIPSKAILDIAHRYHSIKEIESFLTNKIDFKPSWDKIKEHKNKVVNSIRTSLEKLFVMKNIEIIRGKARINSPHSIEVENNGKKTTYEFDVLVIATGTQPFYPPPFNNYKEYLTDSDKIFDLPTQPQTLTIIGAGVIGMEMACFFNATGTQVNVVDIMPDILIFEDKNVTKVLKSSLERRGVKFYLNSKAKDVVIEGKEKKVILETGEVITSDEIMIAAGRVCDLDGLNLSAAQVEYDKFIKVNNKLETSNKNIYAIGDVNGISLLAHSATRQGEIVAENIMGANEEFDKDIVPTCIYTWPEIASVGMRAEDAKKKGMEIKVKKAFFQVQGKAIATLNTEGFIQLLLDKDDSIVGCQIAGGPATEIIHILSLAIKFKMKVKDLKSIIYAHPTMSEIILEAINK